MDIEGMALIALLVLGGIALLVIAGSYFIGNMSGEEKTKIGIGK